MKQKNYHKSSCDYSNFYCLRNDLGNFHEKILKNKCFQFIDGL